MTTIETELEKYELQQAAKVWGALKDADRERLLRLPVWKTLKKGSGVSYKADDYIDEPDFQHLIEVGLTVDKFDQQEYTLIPNFSCPNPDKFYQWRSGYHLTTFGKIVQRYGRAARIVELAGG